MILNSVHRKFTNFSPGTFMVGSLGYYKLIFSILFFDICTLVSRISWIYQLKSLLHHTSPDRKIESKVNGWYRSSVFQRPSNHQKRLVLGPLGQNPFEYEDLLTLRGFLEATVVNSHELSFST